MAGEGKSTPKPRMTDAEFDELEALKCRIIDPIVREWEEKSLWEPTPSMQLLPWEMGCAPDPSKPLPSEVERPEPEFPYRAMTEEEVRVFAQGVGRMAANAMKAEEEAYAKEDAAMDDFYRAQASRLLSVLTLLRRVLRGEWPRSDA